MKKLFYLGFCVMLSLGVGCAITNYSLIMDNDQVANGQGTGVVNTNGKAHLRESSQIATIWPDGTDEWIAFVDQKANGDRTITNYNNFSTGGDPTFHDDQYCNPDWAGCSMVTADDPEVGDADIFDYTYNINCQGIRSISLLLSTTRYYGECGRANMSIEDRISFMNLGRIGNQFGMTGLFYDFNNLNTTIKLNNLAGFETTIPMTANVGLFTTIAGNRKGSLDLTHPGLRAMGNYYADFLDQNATNRTLVTVVYNGISFSKEIAGRIEGRPLTQASRVREIMNRSF